MPATVEVTFYRIMQEALANVAAHSHATRADVVLAASAGSIALIVEDDGVGFDTDAVPEQIRFSLAAMRERAALAGATLIVESMPDNGTSVLVRYPLRRLPEAWSGPDTFVCLVGRLESIAHGMSEHLTIRILIADDHLWSVMASTRLIDDQPGMKVVAEAMNGRRRSSSRKSSCLRSPSSMCRCRVWTASH